MCSERGRGRTLSNIPSLPHFLIISRDNCVGVLLKMVAPYQIASRSQILSLLAVGFEHRQIFEYTGVMPDTQKVWWKKALSRGFNPHARPLLILDIYVEDGKRTGRPSKMQDEQEEVLGMVCKDRQGRELLLEQIAERLGNRISAATVWKILHEAGLNKMKPTRKPGLSESMRKAWLEWCLAYQSWSLEDWKHVIWSDETSVVLCVRRGGYRVWRKADESVNKTAIRERWKGYSEFMFWACFSYD